MYIELTNMYLKYNTSFRGTGGYKFWFDSFWVDHVKLEIKVSHRKLVGL